MNVIVANKYKDVLSNLDIDVIKKMDGEFDVDTIIDTFANFYFNRMILDITALKDCFNIATIQKLSASLDSSKIILYLSDDPRLNNTYLSNIISLGIYNFTRDITGVTYLMDNPNSYRDVAQYHELAKNDERELKSKSSGGLSSMMRPNNTVNTPTSNRVEETVPMNDNSSNTFFNNSMNDNYSYTGGSVGTRVIGFKDLTSDAGATTLVYMLKKNLENKRKVLGVEINNTDFKYFRDNELMSISSTQVASVKNKFSGFDVVLIDLNDSNLDKDGTCTDVIYLLEPSTIKLNGLMTRDRQALEKLKGQKIVLNKSLLNVSDLHEFEYEAKVKMFYNIPPLDERKGSQMVLDSFLEKLGVLSNGNQGGIFSIFKK